MLRFLHKQTLPDIPGNGGFPQANEHGHATFPFQHFNGIGVRREDDPVDPKIDYYPGLWVPGHGSPKVLPKELVGLMFAAAYKIDLTFEGPETVTLFQTVDRGDRPDGPDYFSDGIVTDWRDLWNVKDRGAPPKERRQVACTTLAETDVPEGELRLEVGFFRYAQFRADYYIAEDHWGIREVTIGGFANDGFGASVLNGFNQHPYDGGSGTVKTIPNFLGDATLAYVVSGEPGTLSGTLEIDSFLPL